ncbi:MAG: quaternary ammonium compound-resistance protein SugE [Candidatus Methanoplasma sp.]|jgi:quaternary ammonium compound-resistance protein SugE|nr:quaternary ammonium compound-resistance protein SugE [Candidatus Methanoplasma sp.]
MEMGWAYLLAASALEPCWVVALEKSDGFRRALWGAVTIASIMACLYLLALAVAELGPGLSYALLAGIGAVIVVGIGAVAYREALSARRVAFVSMIVIGVIGVRLSSGGMI